jgi:hypothetical protein
VEDTEFIGEEECEESKQIALYRCSVDMSPRAGDIFHAQRSGADKLKRSYMQRETLSKHDVMRPPRPPRHFSCRVETKDGRSRKLNIYETSGAVTDIIEIQGFLFLTTRQM